MKPYILILLTLMLACKSAEKKPPMNLQFRVVESEYTEGLEECIFPQSGETFYLCPPADIGAADVKAADVIQRNGRPVIDVTFTNAGAEKLAKLTGANIGKRIAIIVEGEILFAPTVRDTIKNGRAQISGNFTPEEAEKIAEGIVGAR